jgi:hypothetical protein
MYVVIQPCVISRYSQFTRWQAYWKHGAIGRMSHRWKFTVGWNTCVDTMETCRFAAVLFIIVMQIHYNNDECHADALIREEGSIRLKETA